MLDEDMRRQTARGNGIGWSLAETAKLRHLWAELKSTRAVAAALGRSVPSCYQKGRRMGLAAPNKPDLWDSARTEELIKLWGDGLSASQIAGRLGVTRNAVIGKVNRLGLSQRNPALCTRVNQARPKPPKFNFARKPKAPQPGSRANGRGVLQSLPAPPVPYLNIPFIERKSTQCATIVNDKNECCGLPVTYRNCCSFHAHLHYQIKSVA